MKQSLFLKRTLMDGEQVLYVAGIHFMFIVKAAFIALLLLAAGYGISFLFGMSGLVPVPYGPVPMYFLGGIGALYFIWRCLWMLTVEIVLTNKRFLFKRGVIFVQQSKLDVFGLDSCEIRQTVFGTWLDYGDILISTAAVSDGDPRLPSINHPGEFTKAFENKKNAHYGTRPVIAVPVGGE